MIAARTIARRAPAALAKRPAAARCVAILRRVTSQDKDEDISQSGLDTLQSATDEADLWRAVFGRKSSSPPSFVDAIDEEDVFTTSIDIKATSQTTAEDVAQETEVDLWGMVFGAKKTNAVELGATTLSEENVSVEENPQDMDLWGTVFGAKQPECIREDPPTMSDVSSPSPAPLKVHPDVWTSVFGNRDV